MDSAHRDQSGSGHQDFLLSAVQKAGVPDRPGVDVGNKVQPPLIHGVELERFTGFHDNRGSMIPTLDVRKAFWREPVIYAYLVTVRPGTIKGWGMHKVQTDRYSVLRGQVRVVLFDGREDSPDKGSFCEIWFTDECPGLLRIPPGVWHADQNWGSTEALIMNYPTHAYNPADPDKYRIDPHSGIIPFKWELKDG